MQTTLQNGPGCLSDYYDWFKGAPSGAALVYWRGDLQFDRDAENFRHLDDFDSQAPHINALNVLANRVHADARDGHLILVQKRHGESDYEYRAIRRRPLELGGTARVTKLKNDNLVTA